MLYMPFTADCTIWTMVYRYIIPTLQADLFVPTKPIAYIYFTLTDNNFSEEKLSYRESIDDRRNWKTDSRKVVNGY